MSQALNDTEQDEDAVIMATHTLGKDLLGLLVQEFKALPKVWQALSENQQNDVIDRARKAVEDAARTAVGLIVSNGKISVIADIEGVTIKDDIKATFKISRGNSPEAMQAMFSSHNQACQIILSSAAQYTEAMHEVKGEADQRALGLDGDEEEEIPEEFSSTEVVKALTKSKAGKAEKPPAELINP